MNKEEKAAAVEEIAQRLGEAEAIFAVDYRGISVTEAAELRSNLREADATFRVVKNRLAKRAAEQAGTDELQDLLDGPTALTFVKGDAVIAAKAIATSPASTTCSTTRAGSWTASRSTPSSSVRSPACPASTSCTASSSGSPPARSPASSGASPR